MSPPEVATGAVSAEPEPVTVQSASLRLIVDVARGAKIRSVENRCTGREWLLQSPERWPQPPRYGMNFVDYELAGWDEMFPTVDACECLGEPVTPRTASCPSSQLPQSATSR
jgi:hypothetical protein